MLSNKKPQPQYYMKFPIGRTKVRLNTAMIGQNPKSGLRSTSAGRIQSCIFRCCRRSGRTSSATSVIPLEWHEMPDGQDSRIAYYLNEVDVENRADWQRQHQWLVEQANAFYQIFAPRVCKLDLDIDPV